jgi:hypothetical protein
MAEQHITNNSPHPGWTSEDASNLRGFLRTVTGSKFLGMLAQLRPGLGATNVEAAALEGKVVSGWEQCVELVLRAGLLKPTQEVIEPVNYPDLDGDEGWEAGLQKPAESEPEVLESQADIENLTKRKT